MTRLRFRAFFVLAAFLLVVPAVATGLNPVRAQDATPVATAESGTMPLAEALPASTAAYIATEFDTSSDQYLQLGSLATQIVIPGAGDTVSSIVQWITQFLSLIPSDLKTVLEGEIGVAIASPPSQDDEDSDDADANPVPGMPGYAVVLHPVEAAKAREAVESWFSGRVADDGGEVQQSQDGSVVVLQASAGDSGSISAPAVVVFSGDYILLGNDTDSLEPFIEVTQGDAPPLADSEDLQQLNAALPAERLLFGYFDSGALMAPFGGFDIMSVPVSSLDPPAGPTAFTVAADDIGFRFESVSIPLNEDGGLFDRNQDEENPDFASRVPDTTMALFAGKDLGQSWAIEQLEKVLLTALVGSQAGGVDLTDFDVAQQFSFLSMLTGIDFKKDLIDQLEGDYGLALFSLDASSPAASSAVISSELDNPDLVSVAVTSLGPLIQSSGAGNASVTTASIDGQTVNNVTLDTGSVDATIQYGVVDDQLMVGLGNGIETLATSPAAPLSESSAYQAALAELPDSYDGVVYIDVRSLAEQIAPRLVDSLAEDSNNSILRCLAGSTDSETATPVVEDSSGMDAGSWIVDIGCSIASGLLGGDSALLDLITSRVPGPLVAVSYNDGDLQRVSGVLLVGESGS